MTKLDSIYLFIHPSIRTYIHTYVHTPILSYAHTYTYTRLEYACKKMHGQDLAAFPALCLAGWFSCSPALHLIPPEEN